MCAIFHLLRVQGYMRQWIGSALVEMMACRLFGAQAIIKTNDMILSIGPLATKFRRNFNQNSKLLIHKNSSEKKSTVK